MIGGAAQVIRIEAQGLLQLRLVRDADVGTLPEIAPARRMQRDLRIEIAPVERKEVLDRRFRTSRLV